MEEREKIAHRVLYTDFVSNSPDIARERKGGKKKKKERIDTLSFFSLSFAIFESKQRLEIPESDDEAWRTKENESWILRTGRIERIKKK